MGAEGVLHRYRGLLRDTVKNGGRQVRSLLPEQLLDDVLAAVRPSDTIGGVISRMSRTHRPDVVKAAVLGLKWQQRLATDLHGHLGSDSSLEMTA